MASWTVFPEPDLVGQHEASAAKAMPLHRQAYEELLVRPEPLLASVDGALDRDRGRLGVLLPLGERDHLALGQPLDVGLDERATRQVHCGRVVPQGVELLAHPLRCFGAVVLPEQLVVQLPGRRALVDAPEKRRRAPVGVANDTGLAMDEPEDLIGQNLDLHLPLPVGQGRDEHVVETLDARPGGVRQILGATRAPAVPEGRLGGNRRLHVLGPDVRVADDAHRARDGFELLPCDLEEAGTEVPGNPVVGARPLETRMKHALVDGCPPRGMPRDHAHPWSPRRRPARSRAASLSASQCSMASPRPSSASQSRMAMSRCRSPQ